MKFKRKLKTFEELVPLFAVIMILFSIVSAVIILTERKLVFPMIV